MIKIATLWRNVLSPFGFFFSFIVIVGPFVDEHNFFFEQQMSSVNTELDCPADTADYREMVITLECINLIAFFS